MGRTKRPIVEESGSESEEVERDLGRDMTTELGAPFTVFEYEVERYESVKKRKVKPPIRIDFAFWERKAGEGDLFALKFVHHIKRLQLETWAGLNLRAYPRLVKEFYTTCSVTDDGDIECRMGGKWFSFDKYKIMELFGFYARVASKDKKNKGYNENEWWEEIKCKGIGETERNPISAVQDNALYYFYRYLATSFWGKKEPSKIVGEELYILWKMTYLGQNYTPDNYPINVYPPLLATIKTSCSLGKKNPLPLGAFITALALSEDWVPERNEPFVAPRKLKGGMRRLRTPLQPWGKWVPMFELRDRDADEDEGFDPNAPRGPAPLAVGDDETEQEHDPEAQPEPPQPAPRARARKSTRRPGCEDPGPSSEQPSRIARVAWEDPYRADFEEIKNEMRSNHQAVMDGQAAMRAESVERHRVEMEGQAAIRAELRGSREDRRNLLRGQASLIADLRGSREENRMILRAQANLMTELRTMREDLIGKYGYEVSSDGDAFDSEEDGGPSEP